MKACKKEEETFICILWSHLRLLSLQVQIQPLQPLFQRTLVDSVRFWSERSSSGWASLVHMVLNYLFVIVEGGPWCGFSPKLFSAMKEKDGNKKHGQRGKGNKRTIRWLAWRWDTNKSNETTKARGRRGLCLYLGLCVSFVCQRVLKGLSLRRMNPHPPSK